MPGSFNDRVAPTVSGARDITTVSSLLARALTLLHIANIWQTLVLVMVKEKLGAWGEDYMFTVSCFVKTDQEQWDAGYHIGSFQMDC